MDTEFAQSITYHLSLIIYSESFFTTDNFMLKSTIYILILTILSFVAAFGQTPTPLPSPGTVEFEKARADRLQSRYNDYAQLGRYHEANAKLATPAKDENRVVFLGDSITDFWKLNEFFPNQPYINRGISAQTTPQMLKGSLPRMWMPPLKFSIRAPP